MRTVSTEMSNLLHRNSTLRLRATLTYADGTSEQLSDADFIEGTAQFEQATSSDQSFDVGGCVVGRCSLTLNNHEGKFDHADFTGATIMCYVGKDFSGGTEWIRMGVYNVVQPDSYDGTIALECHDNLSLLSQAKYSDVDTEYPCLPSQALEDICSKCGVILDWGSDRLNDSTKIQRRPDDSDISCLQAAAYLAQLMGLWLRATDYGHVLAAWYDTGAFDSGITWADATQEWGSEEAAQSLWSDTRALITTGSELRRGTARITQAYTSTVRTDDVVITGVRVTEQNEVKEDESGNLTNGADGRTALAGSTGYVIAIEQNPFIEYGRAADVAEAIYGRVGGMRFRPFELTAPSDPSIEAGDSIVYLDRKQKSHTSYVTSVTLAVDDAMTVRCSAKSAARNSATGASASTLAVVRLRNEVKRAVTARDLALADLAEKVSQSSGVYHSEQVMDDGSIIHYLHDKPDVADSGIVWKMTADAVAVSTDGGQTYVTGISATGDAVLNRIYAIGIDADHITTGKLSSHDGENYFDLDTGEARFSAGTKIGGHSVATQVDVLYAISDSPGEAPKDDQWSTTAPKWQEGRYIWSKTRTYHGTEFVDSDPECITGARGESVTITGIQYSHNGSGTIVPDSGWQDDVPAVDPGGYLWCRVTYSDGTATHTCSRMGEDGRDGTSVAIQSATKADGVTTLVVSDGTQTRTLTIEDGQDGQDGQPGGRGEDGKTAYVHIAWATSADGSEGFSSSDSAGKTYIGVYTDHEQKDSDKASDYSWSLIKGSDGTGVTVSRVEYAVTPNGQTQPTAWSADQQTVDKGNWLWCRTTYSDGTSAVTRSYAGTDGEDGTSVSVQSVTKADGVTTVTLADSSGRTYSMDIADGQDGEEGQPGSPGRDGAPSYVHVAWADAVTGGDTGWSDTSLEWSAYPGTWGDAAVHVTGFSTTDSSGKLYMGVCSDESEPDPTDPTAYTWALIKGADGADGAPGQDGESVTVSSVTFAPGDSGTTPPATGWQRSVPAVAQGRWLWCRTEYSDGTSADTCSYMGTDGTDGNSVAVEGVRKANGVTTVTLRDSAGTATTLRIADGTDGTDGKPGADGTSSYVHIAWATSADGMTGFSNSDSVGKTYIGVYSDSSKTDSDYPSDYSWSLIKGADGKDGQDGRDGNGISTVTVTYGTSSDAGTVPSAWQSTVPPVADGKWLWTRTVIDYTDPERADTVTYTYARQGQDGKSVSIKGSKSSTAELPSGASAGDGYLVDGYLWVWTGTAWSNVGKIQGPAGNDGVSVSVRSIEYQVGSSATTAPTGSWSSTPVSAPQGQWLWTRTTFSDGSTAYGVARQGADGKSPTATVSKSGKVSTITVRNADGTSTTTTVVDGEDGTAGAAGYVHVKYSDDGGKSFTGNGGETPGGWLGQYTDHVERDSTSVSDYAWYRIKGQDGDSIDSITEEYYLSTSSTSLSGGSWSESQPTWTKGHYIWTRSRIEWTLGNGGGSSTTYSTPQLARGLNSANESADAAKDEVDGLDQTAIFNRLTNNGQTQGLYMQDGRVYLNGEYLRVKSGGADVFSAGYLNADLIAAKAIKASQIDTTGLTVKSDLDSYISASVNGSTAWLCGNFQSLHIQAYPNDWTSIGAINLGTDSVNIDGSSDFSLTRTGDALGKRYYKSFIYLYSNSSGTTGTVTLSHSASSYDYVVICFRDDNEWQGSVLVPMVKFPAYVSLSTNYYKGGVGWYGNTKQVSISGSTISAYSGANSWSGRGYIAEGGSSVSGRHDTSLIWITHVIGIRN